MNGCKRYFNKAWWDTRFTPSERRILICFYGRLGECLQGKDQQLSNAAKPVSAAKPVASIRQARDAAKVVSDKVRPLRRKLLQYRSLYPQEEYLLIEAVLDRKSQTSGQRQGYVMTVAQMREPESQHSSLNNSRCIGGADNSTESVLLVRNVTLPHSIPTEQVKIYQQPSRAYRLDDTLLGYQKQLLSGLEPDAENRILRAVPEFYWPTRDQRGDLATYTLIGQPVRMLDYLLSNRVADCVVGKNVKKPVWEIFDNIRSVAIRQMACPVTLQVVVSSKLSSKPAFCFVQKCDVEAEGWQYDITAAGFIATDMAMNASLWGPIIKSEEPQLSRYEQGLVLLNTRRAIQLTLRSVLGVLKPDLRDGQQSFLAHAIDSQDGTHGLVFHLETDSDLSKHFLPQGSTTLARLQIGNELDDFLRRNYRRTSPWLLLAVDLLKIKHDQP